MNLDRAVQVFESKCWCLCVFYTIAFTLVASAAIYRIAPISGFTGFTVGPSCQAVAWHWACFTIVASTMACRRMQNERTSIKLCVIVKIGWMMNLKHTVTLTTWTSCKEPIWDGALWWILRSAVAAQIALAQSSVRTIIAPTTCWIITTLNTWFIKFTLWRFTTYICNDKRNVVA